MSNEVSMRRGQQILDLKLKAILHKGEVAFKKIRQFDELAGQEGILAHRLLKNTIPSREYIVMTEPVYMLIGELLRGREELCEEDSQGSGSCSYQSALSG